MRSIAVHANLRTQTRSVASSFVHSAHSVRPNPAFSRFPLFLQPKLAISQPGDPYEQEADRVAEQVMRMPIPTVQRQCAACAAGEPPCPACQEESVTISRKVGGVVGHEAPASVPSVLASAGSPLSESTRAFFEPRFGQDLSQVRVHTEGEAQQSARDVNALAYTVGSHIVFRDGQYAPQSPDGQRLLAHELTHVVQQSAASSGAGALQRQPASDDEIEMPGEFAGDERKRTWRRYARQLGQQDAARIRQVGTLSAELRDELNAKLRFFVGDAHAVYVNEIKRALVAVLAGSVNGLGSSVVSPGIDQEYSDNDHKDWYPEVVGQPVQTPAPLVQNDAGVSRPAVPSPALSCPVSSSPEMLQAEMRQRVIEELEHDVDIACHPPTRRCKYARATLETFLRTGELVEYRNYDGGPGPVNVGVLYGILGMAAIVSCLENPFGCAMAFGIAASTSEGGFKGCGAVAGFGALIAVRVPPGAVILEGGAGAARILSPVIRYAERDIVVVETSQGTQAFYRSTGINSGKEGSWFPFDGSIDVAGGFLKERFTTGAGLTEGHQLWRYGTSEFKVIAEQLGKMSIPTGQQVGTSYEVNLMLQRLGARNPLD